MTIVSSDASPASEALEPNAIDAANAVIDNDTGAVIDANPADSSTVDAPDANKPLDLLSVIKSAVEPVKAPEASSAPEGNAEEPAVAAEAPQADAAPEDDAKLPFHEHPRWKAVLAERDSYREPAERYGQITSFMDTHGLLPDEVAEGFEIMALLKSGDPESLSQAREWFDTRLQGLNEMLGAVLPEDLQTRVDEGLIDEESAAELARARAAAALNAKKGEADEARSEQERTAAQQTEIATAMVTAVEGWEQRTKASDPDYAKKAELVETTCRAIISRTGRKAPVNAEEAVALADEALAEVNRQFKSLLPKPRAISPAPAGTSTTAAKAPSTLREAVQAGLARSR